MIPAWATRLIAPSWGRSLSSVKKSAEGGGKLNARARNVATDARVIRSFGQ